MTAGTQWWLQHKQSPLAAEAMWETWKAPHRQHLLLGFMCMPEVASVYEIGCGSGPNLRLLRRQFPDLQLAGSEPCEGLAAWASEHVGCHVDRTFLPEVPGEADVLISCYTLAYVEEEVARETLKSARAQHLILMEPNWGVVSGLVGVPEFAHDYIVVLKDTGWDLRWRWPILPPVQGLNATIVASR